MGRMRDKLNADLLKKMQAMIVANIKKHGFHITWTWDDETKLIWAYTIGLTESYGCPEIIVMGLNQGNASALIHAAVRQFQAEGPIPVGVPQDQIANLPVVFRKAAMAKIRPLMLGTFAYYQEVPWDALQLVLPDPKGLFPWEEGFEMAGQLILFEE